MKVIHAAKHIGIILLGAAILLLLPFSQTDYFSALLSGNLDAISAATTAVAAPSGDYVILINACMHTDQDILDDWVTFFNDGDIGFNFENLRCEVIAGDSGAADMAAHFQGRLPENQLIINSTVSTMLLSRIKYGQFDIVILSKEFADSYDLSDNLNDDTIVISYKGTTESET